MNICIAKSVFLKELILIQGIAEKKNTIPILSHLLIESANDKIVIKATDLDVSITTQCEAEVKEAGAICVQAKKIFEIVRSLPESEIEIISNDQDQVMIVCERSKFKMVGLGRDSFPPINEFVGPFISLPSSLLSTFIQHTVFAITNEESRYALNGAKFELSKESVRMIATDGHRLSFIEKQDKFYEGDKIDALIPRKTLAELIKLCATASGVVDFGKDDNHLYFNVDGRRLASRILSGQFPNYELVLPKDKRVPITFDNQRLFSSVKRVSLMADEKSHSVRVELSSGQVRISSQAADIGESEDVLLIEYNGPSITIGFNAQYLLDFFSVCQNGDITLEIKDANSQVQIRSTIESDYDFRYIVMPMRL